MAFDDLLDNGKDKLTDWNEGRKKRSSELKATFIPKSGKRYVTSSLMPNITIYQQNDGYVYFNKDDSILFEFCDYIWEGPQYRTVVNTVTKGKEKGETKRKGRVIGAVVGTMLVPGVGTIIGAAHGTGNKKSKKDINSHSKTYQDVEEIKVSASIKVKNIQTNEYTVLTFDCDSKLNSILSQFIRTEPTLVENTYIDNVEETDTKNIDPYDELKKVKELLDMGIITQEEFDLKKKELLGL